MFDVDTMIRHLRDLFADHVISYRTMLGLALCSRAISGQIFFFFLSLEQGFFLAPYRRLYCG